MKKLFLTLVYVFTIYFQTNAQDCKVLLPALEGEYSGKCKKGLAHGQGKAIGKDTFVGKFKKGLPHGDGEYTYSETGDIFKGSWKYGKRDGMGTLYLKSKEGEQLIGYWVKDKYVGKTKPVAYKITKMTSVTRYSLTKKEGQNKVIINFMRGGTYNHSVVDLLFTSSSGSYYQSSQDHGFDNVEFPFECSIVFLTKGAIHAATFQVKFDFTIFEPGTWVVKIYN